MFKGCHFPKPVVLTCIRWYLRYKLSYRDLEEMMGCLVAQSRQRASYRLNFARCHSIITPSGIPSAVITFRMRHPILASTLCDDSRLARIAEPTIALYR